MHSCTTVLNGVTKKRDKNGVIVTVCPHRKYRITLSTGSWMWSNRRLLRKIMKGNAEPKEVPPFVPEKEITRSTNLGKEVTQIIDT